MDNDEGNAKANDVQSPRTLEERLHHVEETLGRLLEHNGETYIGAGEDRRKLNDPAKK